MKTLFKKQHFSNGDWNCGYSNLHNINILIRLQFQSYFFLLTWFKLIKRWQNGLHSEIFVSFFCRLFTHIAKGWINKIAYFCLFQKIVCVWLHFPFRLARVTHNRIQVNRNRSKIVNIRTHTHRNGNGVRCTARFIYGAMLKEFLAVCFIRAWPPASLLACWPSFRARLNILSEFFHPLLITTFFVSQWARRFLMLLFQWTFPAVLNFRAKNLSTWNDLM